MSKKFNELLSEIKAQLKDSLTSESSQEEIQRISQLDKSLDLLSESYQEKEKEVATYKDMVIDQVKSTGFKADSTDETGASQIKSLDEALEEALMKIEAKQNGK